MNSTLYNMTFGALGALVLLLSFNIMRSVGRLHPTTWLRNATRRVLGIEAFEELTLSELRSYRVDVDRWTRDVRAEVRRMGSGSASVREDVATRMAADRTRNNRVRTEVEELGILLRRYTDALGPMWQTAQGHRMPMRLLSSGHLRNIIEGAFGPRESREFAASELRRRSVDAGYRADAAAGKPAPTAQQMRNIAQMKAQSGRSGRADPRLPASYTPAVAVRVARVLPQWAQKIIGELVQEGPRAMNFATRKRIKRLPIWAQQTIHDLRQPR